MRDAGLDEAQAGIKIARRNFNNLRYAGDTTLMAECEEELNSLLMNLLGRKWSPRPSLPPSSSFLPKTVFGKNFLAIDDVHMLDTGSITKRSKLFFLSIESYVFF